MTIFVALLRGVNLGKRQVRSADLKLAFEGMGFAGVKTLLASGNVLFEARSDKGLKAKIEKGLEATFGFDVGTVLRRQDELKALVKSDPFMGRVEDERTKLYVTFLDEPTARTLPMPCGVPGNFEVVNLTDKEVFVLAFKVDDVRYGLGMEQIWKHFGKKSLWTSRNWNTVVKAAG
jgi:uncharacterized protein (DUF1697 family)